MRALVIYDSKFGNTRDIALTIADSIRSDPDAHVEVTSATEFTSFPDGLDLLVLGAPTQAHGLEATMRECLDRLPVERLPRLHVAVFDTRMHWPKLVSGSAAEGMAKALQPLGVSMLNGPESFFVDGKEGPLRAGEVERAADWGWFLVTEMKMHAKA